MERTILQRDPVALLRRLLRQRDRWLHLMTDTHHLAVSLAIKSLMADAAAEGHEAEAWMVLGEVTKR